jgi:subtilisin family serine protease
MSGGYNPAGFVPRGETVGPVISHQPVTGDRLSNNTAGMAAFSGRGPTLDGRLKPDVVAPGSNIVSTRYPGASTGWGVYNAYYLYMGGTSMATPLVAGGSAVVREFYADTHGISNPSAALVKATLINGAHDMTPGQYGAGATQDVIRRPDINQGWGRVDLYDSLVYDAPRKLWFYQHPTGLTTAQDYSVTLRITNGSDPFRITVVWTDYPGTEAANGGLVNDLDLTVIAPDGTTYTGNDLFSDGSLDGDVDHTNNVEGIDIASPRGRLCRPRPGL